MITFYSSHGFVEVDEITGKPMAVHTDGCCKDEGGCWIEKITRFEVGDYIRWCNKNGIDYKEGDILDVSVWIGREYDMYARDRFDGIED
jgi:hypothetical protein